jgi:hypothetical protein
VTHRETPDVSLIYERVTPGDARRPIAVPVELTGRDQRAGNVEGIVPFVRAILGARTMDPQRPVRHEIAFDLTGVGIKQKLVGIGEDPGRRIPATVNPKTVFLSGSEASNEPVVDRVGAARQGHAGLVVAFKEAKLDCVGMGGMDGEVPAVVAERGARVGAVTGENRGGGQG